MVLEGIVPRPRLHLDLASFLRIGFVPLNHSVEQLSDKTRRLFKRSTGLTPGQYRRMFRPFMDAGGSAAPETTAEMRTQKPK
jgi:hypothetical protein